MLEWGAQGHALLPLQDESLLQLGMSEDWPEHKEECMEIAVGNALDDIPAERKKVKEEQKLALAGGEGAAVVADAAAGDDEWVALQPGTGDGGGGKKKKQGKKQGGVGGAKKKKKQQQKKTDEDGALLSQSTASTALPASSVCINIYRIGAECNGWADQRYSNEEGGQLPGN